MSVLVRYHDVVKRRRRYDALQKDGIHGGWRRDPRRVDMRHRHHGSGMHPHTVHSPANASRPTDRFEATRDAARRRRQLIKEESVLTSSHLDEE